MRMLKPSPGELADRQSILELKIEHVDKEIVDVVVKEPIAGDRSGVTRTIVEGGDKKLGTHHFFDELELIQNCLRQNWMPDIMTAADPTKVNEYDHFFDDLTEVNSNLWKLQDQIRILRLAPDKFEEIACRRAAEVAYAIDELNEKRAELVKSINALWSINAQEKIYA